jgi:hypothetical protein
LDIALRLSQQFALGKEGTFEKKAMWRATGADTNKNADTNLAGGGTCCGRRRSDDMRMALRETGYEYADSLIKGPVAGSCSDRKPTGSVTGRSMTSKINDTFLFSQFIMQNLQ